MAFKVKYRIKQADNKWKVRLAWDLLGMHPENRGKTFPAALTCQNLIARLVQMGVVSEEADHMGCVIQEVPQSRRLDN